MQEPAPGGRRNSAYICEYDDEGADISVTPETAPFGRGHDLFDTIVAPPAAIYAIVGNHPIDAARLRRKSWKTSQKSEESDDESRWYAHCSGFTRKGIHMSPNVNLLNRVRSEFIEMPGLRLRIDQAQRLWNLDRAICESVLRSLVDAKFLGRFDDDLYARL